MKRNFITLLVVFMLTFGRQGLANGHPSPTVRQKNDGMKGQALVILQGKCNVCHQRQNPGKVFTAENMDTHAPKIHKQVFVKRRMPRGNEIKLSEEEKDTLLQWLKTLGIGSQNPSKSEF